MGFRVEGVGSLRILNACLQTCIHTHPEMGLEFWDLLPYLS